MPNKLGQCCVIDQTIEIVVDLEACPKIFEEKCHLVEMEPGIDDLELRFWPLMAKFITAMRSEGVLVEFLGGTPTASEFGSSEPFVRQSMSFSAQYKFNPLEPENVLIS